MVSSHTKKLIEDIVKEVLAPAEDLTVAEWADKYRILSRESAAEAGKWDTNRTPYMKEILMCITDIETKKITMMCSAQIGKTEMLLNVLGRYMHLDPCPILFVQPTVDDAKSFSKERVEPMIRDTQILKRLISKTNKREEGTVQEKMFPGGYVRFVGANGIVSIAMDAEGMLPDALEAACQQRKPALIYLIPTIQNPTTATMSQARRAAILAIARRHGVAVVEDDPYWLLAADAAPPLAVDSHPDAPVYYVSTLSKCLAPGLRTAYLVVPPGEPMEPLLDALRSIALMPTQSMVAVASHWIRSGQADEMVRRFQQELRQRQQIAARILPKPYQAHPSGLHVWLPLPPRLDQYRLIQAAQAQGLGIASSEAFSIEEQAGNAIRLSLGGAVDQHSLAAALTKLTEVISAAPETRTQAIV